MAVAVFSQTTVPRFIAETLRAFPRADQLPPDAFGALVSLVFNRGPKLEGKNRQDMQDIHNILADGVQSGDLKAIATQLREMKEIWRGQGVDGLLRRRWRTRGAAGGEGVTYFFFLQLGLHLRA